MEMNRLLARLLWGSGDAAAERFTYEEAKRLANHPDPEVRRSLARRPDVVPEILYFLTGDPDPEVRRHIAANTAAPRQADLKLAQDADAEVRADLARKIARIAPGLSAAEQDKVRQAAYDTLALLARDQLPMVRHVLSEALKSEPGVPPEVIGRLARDIEIIVAAPVLEFSPVLTDADLTDIIRTSPVAGALSAIARRANLAAPVSDTIAASADVEAIAELLSNESAQLREETLDALVARARTLPRLHEPLVRRPHLPQGAARRLATFIADNLLTVLAARRDLPSETVEAVRHAVHERLAEAPPTTAAEERRRVEVEAEMDKARLLRDSGQLSDPLVLEALASGHLTFVKAALAVRADLPVPVVLRILTSASAKAVTALAWRAGFDMDATVMIQTRLAHISPDDALPGSGRLFPLTEGEMKTQIAVFESE